MNLPIRKINVGMSRKVVKNYQSTEVQVSMEADLPADVDPMDAKRYLAETCEGMIREEFQRLGKLP